MNPDLANGKTAGVTEILLTAVAAFWLGLIVLLFVAVPTIFSTLADDRTMAGKIAAGIFHRTEIIRIILSAGVIVFGVAAYLKHRGRAAISLPLLALVGGAAVAIGVWYVSPAIAHGQAEGTTHTPEFKRLHGLGSGLLLVEAIVALLVIVLTLIVAATSRGRRAESAADGL